MINLKAIEGYKQAPIWAIFDVKMTWKETLY